MNKKVKRKMKQIHIINNPQMWILDLNMEQKEFLKVHNLRMCDYRT